MVRKLLVICRRNRAGRWLRLVRVVRSLKHTARRLPILLLALVVAGLVACSQDGSSRPDSAVLPSPARATGASPLDGMARKGLLQRPRAPYAGPTPPIKAGEKLTYAWSYSGTVTRWVGSTPNPVSSPFSGTGTIQRTYGVDKADGIYELRETTVDNGRNAQRTTNAYFGFATTPTGQLEQLAYLDNWTSSDATGSQSGIDTDRQPAIAWVYPFVQGTSWSGSAPVVWSDDVSVRGANPLRIDESFATDTDGAYAGQDQYTGGRGSNGEDGFSETYALEPNGTGTYGFASPGLGIDATSAVLADVAGAGGHFIPVVTTGTGISAGTADVPDWYPGGAAAPLPLQSDALVVVGTVAMPAQCTNNQGLSATEVDETYSDVDPIEGMAQSENVAYYIVSGGWPACELHHSSFTLYDAGILNSPATGMPYWQRTTDATYLLIGHAPAVAGTLPRALAAMPMLAGTPTATNARIARAKLVAQLTLRRAHRRLRRR